MERTPTQHPRGRSVIKLREISKAFDGQVVLDRVNCELVEGEVVLLMGANGAGKTTLVDIICGFRHPDSGSLEYCGTSSDVVFGFPQPPWRQNGPFVRFRADVVARLGVTRTWQDTRLFPNHELWENISLARPGQLGENPLWALIRPSGVRAQEASGVASATGMLEDLGLPSREGSGAYELSLGESKRVAIARALATGARVLVLDEPFSGLDAPGVESLLEMLKRISREQRITLLIIEHVLNVPRLVPLATQIWTLRSGTLETDSTSGVDPACLASGTHSLINSLVDADTQVETRNLGRGAKLTVLSRTRVGQSALEITNLVVRRGARSVIGEPQPDGHTLGLSISLRTGQTGILEAPNGWGKSSLMLAISGLIPTASGSIRVMEELVSGLPAWRRARLGLGLLQSRENSFPGLSVREVMQLSGLEERILGPSFDHRRVASLSGGERQKLALACFRARRASVTLLDEPWSALDVSGIAMARELLIPREGTASLISMPTGYEEN